MQLSSFTTDVRRLLNPDEDDEDEDGSHRFEMVNTKTYHVISSCVYQAVEREVEVLDWSIGQMKTAIAVTSAQSQGADDSNMNHDLDPAARAELIEQEVFVRFTHIERVLLQCVTANMIGITVEVLLRVITKWYRCLTNLIKYVSSFSPLLPPFSPWPLFSQAHSTCFSFPQKIAQGERPSKQMVELIDVIANFTKETQNFVPQWHEREAKEAGPADKKGKKRKKGGDNGPGSGAAVNSSKAKILRQLRLVPTLIYVMEVFERQLLVLSKQSKVNLTKNFKRSSGRDFRIQGEVLERLRREEEEGSDDDDDDDDDGPKKKKVKREKKVKKEKKGKEKEVEGMMDDEIGDEDDDGGENNDNLDGFGQDDGDADNDVNQLSPNDY